MGDGGDGAMVIILRFNVEEVPGNGGVRTVVAGGWVKRTLVAT